MGPASTRTRSLGPNAAALSTTTGLSAVSNTSDTYTINTSGITNRSTAGLVSGDPALSASRIACVRVQITSLLPVWPRLNSRTNSTSDSARRGAGSSSGTNNGDDRGGDGTYGCGEPTGDRGRLPVHVIPRPRNCRTYLLLFLSNKQTKFSLIRLLARARCSQRLLYVVAAQELHQVP